MISDRSLRQQARRAGILTEWDDYRGRKQVVGVETLRALLRILGATDAEGGDEADIPLITARAGERFALPYGVGSTARAWLTEEGRKQSRRLEMSGNAVLAPDVPGYHRLTIGKREFTLAVAPARYAATARGTACDWGLSVQLYSLYRAGDGGIGSYPALRDFSRSAAETGAAAVAVSPLHAQFSADLSRFSPYAPSSRLWLNALHIDVGEAAAGLGLVAPKLAPRLGTGRDALINWPESSRAKLKALRSLFDKVQARGVLAGGGPLARSLWNFKRRGGQALTDHAGFECLHAHFYGHDRQLWNWQRWPAEFRDARSAAVRRFAREHADDVAFHVFLQWLAAGQFHGAAAAARDAGMTIGIIKDIAVGADGGGSEAWSNPGLMLTRASIGAPPDEFNTLGQAWGVTTFAPHALESTGYRAFLSLLRAALRDAGGIRIDHVLGLQRLWIVPDGMGPREGAYIRYPLADLLRLTALEAHRAGAMVLGEDLGTVPEGFREKLSGFGLRGMQVLWFQRRGRDFLKPSQWTPGAAAMTTTHDLPTVAGWWVGKDIAWRRDLRLFAKGDGAAAATAARKQDRVLLWKAFKRAGVVSSSAPPRAGETGKVVAAAIDFLGRTACSLALLPLEDALGRKEQPNLPGTVTEHPNWRRRVLIPAGDICRQRVVRARLRRLASARTRQ